VTQKVFKINNQISNELLFNNLKVNLNKGNKWSRSFEIYTSSKIVFEYLQKLKVFIMTKVSHLNLFLEPYKGTKLNSGKCLIAIVT